MKKVLKVEAMCKYDEAIRLRRKVQLSEKLIASFGDEEAVIIKIIFHSDNIFMVVTLLIFIKLNSSRCHSGIVEQLTLSFLDVMIRLPCSSRRAFGSNRRLLNVFFNNVCIFRPE